MIYFIQAGDRPGPIKIGYTEGDPKTRLARLQTAHAVPLYLIATMPGDMAREKRLHARFAKGRMLGEWFRHDTPGLQDLLSAAIHFEGFEDDRESPDSIAVLTA